MKNILKILIILFSLNSFCQSAVRFIDNETKEPLCGIYSNIYKNSNTFENCGGTNSEGYKTLKIRKVDSTASYQLSFNDKLDYEPIWKELDPTNKDTITIYLKKNEYYIPSSPNLLSKRCSRYSMSNYYPREPRSLNDIPNEIAEKVTDYLISRVGLKSFKKFKLIGGQIVDINEYKKRNPKSNQKTAYYLCYSYREMESGIAMYTSRVELDEKGDVIKDIAFPKIENPTQEKIFPLSIIIEDAKKSEFYEVGKTKIDMKYFQESNILVWKLINEKYNSDYTYLKEELIFNAHNGNFIKKNSFNGEWID